MQAPWIAQAQRDTASLPGYEQQKGHDWRAAPLPACSRETQAQTGQTKEQPHWRHYREPGQEQLARGPALPSAA